MRANRHTDRQTDTHDAISRTPNDGEAITGSAEALHCCKAHSKINRKMENSTPCKIVTLENFIFTARAMLALQALY